MVAVKRPRKGRVTRASFIVDSVQLLIILNLLFDEQIFCPRSWRMSQSTKIALR